MGKWNRGEGLVHVESLDGVGGERGEDGEEEVGVLLVHSQTVRRCRVGIQALSGERKGVDLFGGHAGVGGLCVLVR